MTPARRIVQLGLLICGSSFYVMPDMDPGMAAFFFGAFVIVIGIVEAAGTDPLFKEASKPDGG